MVLLFFSVGYLLIVWKLYVECYWNGMLDYLMWLYIENIICVKLFVENYYVYKYNVEFVLLYVLKD